MKLLTCLSLLTILLLSKGLHAQISKGSTFLGGSVGYASNKTEMDPNQENTNKGWAVDLQLGKALADNRVAGFFVAAVNTRSEQSNGTNKAVNSNSSYGGGVFYRLYLPIATRWYLFGQGTLGYSTNSGEQKNDNVVYSRYKGGSLSADVSPGLSFAATRVLHVEAALNSLFIVNYQHSKNEYYNPNSTLVNTSKQKQFTTGANLTSFGNISVGLRWIIPAKKKAAPES